MILRAALFLLVVLFAPVAQAQPSNDPFIPGLHGVTGVAADDSLNVRAAPSASAAILGVLAPDTTGLEVTALDETGKWGRIGSGELDGWVSMRYLVGEPLPEGDIPDGMRCHGNEPFWSLDFGQGTATYSAPDAETQSHPIRAASSRLTPRGLTYAFAMNHGGGDLTGFIEAAECSDGMADRTYGWYVKLLWQDPGGVTLQSGCCTLDRR
ncbi:SH3 domain-containing protein [Tropicimonas sp. TH_r6]|uniref:COG3650 family protein n=1 Tax=Tropicimonas sp. TH_r6 TaxID=3082085 RepID=UPI002953BB34|nr:SH3 domain-containing protein [Tropicimonas sp. TH_r6]MDV7145135.1 SH3 domain-containing protein [Tropicimonas sp. TH_r6]